MKNNSPLVHSFMVLAENQPDRLFLDDEHPVTYTELVMGIRQYAQKLAKLTSGRPLVIKGFNTEKWILYFLAARSIGLLTVPISTETTPAQQDELDAVVGPYYVVNTDDDDIVYRDVHLSGYEKPLFNAIGLPTSGTTGIPRCALRSDESLLDEGRRYVQSLGLVAGDRLLVSLPLCHAFSLGFAVGVAAVIGCTLHLVPRFAPRTVNRLLSEGRATVLPLVPATARLLCETFRKSDSLPPNLRCILIGAGRVTPALEEDVLQRLGHRPARGYGSSETGGTIGTNGEHVPDGVTGSPLPGVEIAISGDGNSLGALFVRTTHSFLGYLCPGGLDTSRTSPDHWYSTGDLATRDPNGWITVERRIGEELRRGGHFIQPIEVAQAIQSHPAVSDALVTGNVDENGENVIEAHVEFRPDRATDGIELRHHLEQRLEGYKIPTLWHFYRSMPRTSGGKPDVRKLHESPVLNPSQETGLLTTIFSHRLWTAVDAIWHLGILEHLSTGECKSEDLARYLNLDPVGVQVLLDILVAAGIVLCENDQSYRVVDDTFDIKSLIELEDYLNNTWLSVSSVEKVVRNGIKSRLFEEESPEALPNVYQVLMASSAKLAALYAYRQSTIPEGPILDMGRPAGAWSQLMHRRAPDRQCMILDIPVGYRTFSYHLPDEPLAAIFIHNGVRRFSEPDGNFSLNHLISALRPSGILMVSDIFIDSPGPTPWMKPSLMLDWLTYGNLALLSLADLRSALQTLGVNNIRQARIDPLFDLIIAEK
jgi:long-chain acyl-CoA synthetase